MIDDETLHCGQSNVGPYLMAMLRRMSPIHRATPGSDQFDTGDPGLWGVGSILARKPNIKLFPKRGHSDGSEEQADNSLIWDCSSEIILLLLALGSCIWRAGACASPRANSICWRTQARASS